MTSAASLARISLLARSNVAATFFSAYSIDLWAISLAPLCAASALPVHLPDGLIGGLDEALKGLASLGHALLGERTHLVRYCKLFKWLFGHVRILLRVRHDPSAKLPLPYKTTPGGARLFLFVCQINVTACCEINLTAP